MKDEQYYKGLIYGYFTGRISKAEVVELFDYIKQYPVASKKLLIEVSSLQSIENPESNLLKPADSHRMLRRLLSEINETPVIHLHPNRRSIFKRIAVAASIMLILSTGAYIMSFNKELKRIAKTEQQQRFKNDITPAKQQVVLLLDDGSKIILDSVGNGTLTSQGATKVVKNDETISYVGKNGTEVFYNTISTEKGRTYHLRLADGTDVWLDAMSSLRFPTAFPGAQREVEITGQAYFEVAKNAKQPFRVKAGNEVVEVLGTHFNIKSYEPGNLQTTLLEGSVLVKSAVSEIKIKPGQQARVDNKGNIKLTNNIDLDEIMAWKNGRFQFNGSSVEEIMSHLIRWYDVEVIYKDKITESFVAKIQKDMPVSKLLSLLEMTKQVKFTIEGKKVTVMRYK